MSETKRITFRDVLAWMHCPKAALSGYQPAWPLGDRNLGAKIAGNALGGSFGALRQVVSQGQEAQKWLLRTEFAMLRGEQTHNPAPPKAKGDSYWSQFGTKQRGYHYVDLIDGEAVVQFTIPYLHRPHGVFEAVYVDTQPNPLDMDAWADFTTLVSFHRELFRSMTGEPMYARYIAPAHQTERRVTVPHTELQGLLNMVALAPLTETIRPGAHCESTVKSGQKVRYRCPLREKGKCNPFHS